MTDKDKRYPGPEAKGYEKWDRPTGRDARPEVDSIDLQPKVVVVEAEIPTRGFLPWSEPRTATYRVNLEDWSCSGQVNGLVLADEEWWKEHCCEVGQRVKAKLTEMLT